MRKAVGVICECNPFHNGHQFLFDSIRARFPGSPVVAVMSGNFVQRGEFAVMEKYLRARVLTECGADLVLELPFPYSCLSAERFAANAVWILEKTGLVSRLAFGCEIASSDRLLSVSDRLLSPEFREAFARAAESDPASGYPALREKVYTALYGAEEILSKPNASLALAYLSAIRDLESEIEPNPFLRRESDFDKTRRVVSAARIREYLRAGDWDAVRSAVPPASFQALSSEAEKGRLVLSMEGAFPALRWILRTPGVPNGDLYGVNAVFDRAAAAAEKAESYEDLLALTASSRHTDSRVRRAMLALLTRLSREAEKETPSYTVVLAARKEGRALLNELPADSIPVFTKPAHALRSPEERIRRDFARSHQAEDLLASLLAPALRPLPLTPFISER